MKYNISHKEQYSFATITQRKSPIVTAFITIDTHHERTASKQATEIMYGDALLSGAGKYDRDDFLGAVNLIGAGLNISIADSYLIIKLTSTTETFPKLLSLVEMMFTDPKFSKNELVRIKSSTINTLHEAKENSRAIAYQGLKNTFYGKLDRKHSTSIDIVEKEVETITPKHIKSLHKVVMQQPWTVSVVGEKGSIVTLEKTIDEIKKSIKNKKPVIGANQQKAPLSVAVLKNIPSKQNIDFSIGAPIPITLHHPDYIPLSFAITVLARWGGFTGRLMSTVRELEGLTYMIYGRPEGFSGTEQGFWQIATFFAPDKAVQGLNSTFREVSRLYESGITKAELDKFKIILETQQTLLNDSPSTLLADLHSYHSQKFTLQEMKEHKAKISKLTLKEVNEVIKKYLDPKNLTVSGAGPINSVKKDIHFFMKSV